MLIKKGNRSESSPRIQNHLALDMFYQDAHIYTQTSGGDWHDGAWKIFVIIVNLDNKKGRKGIIMHGTIIRYGCSLKTGFFWPKKKTGFF